MGQVSSKEDEIERHTNSAGNLVAQKHLEEVRAGCAVHPPAIISPKKSSSSREENQKLHDEAMNALISASMHGDASPANKMVHRFLLRNASLTEQLVKWFITNGALEPSDLNFDPFATTAGNYLKIKHGKLFLQEWAQNNPFWTIKSF